MSSSLRSDLRKVRGPLCTFFNSYISATNHKVLPFMQAAMVRSLLDKQPSSRPSAEEVYNGAQLKGLRKALKKSKKSPFVPIV